MLRLLFLFVIAVGLLGHVEGMNLFTKGVRHLSRTAATQGVGRASYKKAVIAAENAQIAAENAAKANQYQGHEGTPWPFVLWGLGLTMYLGYSFHNLHIRPHQTHRLNGKGSSTGNETEISRRLLIRPNQPPSYVRPR